MLKVAVLVSGGGTNLQAILDAVDSGKITNTEIRVVISNNEGAYALERAKNYGTEALLLSPKSFETREEFNQKLLEALKERDIDLVVLAGYLVVVPPCVIKEYENRIINILNSILLWKRLLWSSCSRKSIGTRRKSIWCNRSFCR